MTDDMLVLGSDREGHDKRLAEVLGHLKKAGLTSNKAKCQFGVDGIRFHGVVVPAEGISPHPAKVGAVLKMVPPVDDGAVRRFLGMVNRPKILATSFQCRGSNPGDASRAAFQKVKEMLASEVSMDCYHQRRPTVVLADSSSFVLGAVLLQDQPLRRAMSGGFCIALAYCDRAENSSRRK